MGNSVISHIRQFSLFMKSTATAVIIAFGMLILAPTVVAAQSYDWSFISDPELSVETKLSKAIQQTEELLVVMDDKLTQLQSTTTEQDALIQLRSDIEQLDQAVTANFAAIAEDLQTKGLPAVIQQRQSEMEANYRTQLDELLANLQAIEAATDATDLKAKVEKAKGHLKAKKNRRSHQPFDPNDLPNKALKPNKDNKPKESKAQFQQAGLFDNPYAKVAALGDFTFDQLPGADDPAFLAETDEIRLTQAIKDKAAALNHDPVKIYHWVRNNVEWLPSWGAVQNAELTLSSERGNAIDIASLTISLLRASGIPARYVHGTIDVPEAQFRNWAGDFSNVGAAADYVSSGGIPITGIITGGAISKLRMEHIWVEAAIDYHPSRGAVNKAADSWVAMDPSYKQYEYLQGLDVIQISGIDPDQLAQDFVDSGTVNEQEGWVTGFDPAILQTAQTQAQTQLETYIQDNLTDPTVGDVIGGRSTIVKEFPILPSSLPNPIVTEGARYGTIPNNLQQQITYAFDKDILGDMINPITFPWPRLNNAKVTLSFRPATAADEQALQSLLPEGEITDINQLPSSIPSYLISVIPELKVEGEVVKTGTTMKLGEELDFVTQIRFAHQTHPNRTYKVIAGSYLSVNVIAGSVSAQKLTDLQIQLEATKVVLESNDQAQLAALGREEILGDMFYAGTLGYYAQLQALSHMAGLASKGHYQLAAGIGTIGYEPKVNYFFGFPRAIQPGGITFDIPFIYNTANGDGNVENKKQFTMQVGVISSALEHATPEQMFASQDPNEPPPNAISAVKALQIASSQGQRIYKITQSNISTTLANISHDWDTMDEISASLNAGKEVTTHTNAVSVPGWSGAGYIILDPDTGEGTYKIAGGKNGGEQEDTSNGLNMLLSVNVKTDMLGAYGLDAITIIDCVVKNVIGLLVDFFLFKGVLKDAKNPNSILKRLAWSIGSRTVALVGIYATIIILTLMIVVELYKCISYLIANKPMRKQQKYV
ncbi:MAG: transglutaminase domain-containing protein [Candidatus Thiodiazotropha endolucinida]